MNTFVDFNTAKLLKDKNIKIEVDEVHFYEDEINNIREHQLKNREVLCQALDFNYVVDENQYQTYTIADIVMWLYDNHGIWIEVYPREYKELNLMWSYTLTKIESTYTVGGIEFPDIEKPDDIPIWKSLKEAHLAAIEYCINKLI